METDVIVPIVGLPDNLDTTFSVIRFVLLSPAVEGEEQAECLSIDVPCELHYRGQDAVLIAPSPPVNAAQVEGQAVVSCKLSVSLNQQHFHAVPGLVQLSTRPDSQ